MHEHFTVGAHSGQEGQWTNALAALDSALALVPNNVEALATRSSVYFRLDRFKEAQADLRQAIALEPTDFWAYSTLAYNHISHGAAPEEALPYALKGVEFGHRNPVALIVYGHVQYRLGKFEEAINTLEETENSEQIQTLVANERFILAMAYHRLGNVVKAEQYYQKGLEWIADHPRYSSGITRDDAEPFRAEAAALLGKEPAPQ